MKTETWEKVGRMMIRKGCIKPNDLERCSEVSRRTGGEFRKVLLDLGLISEENLRDVLGEYFRLPVWENGENGSYPVVDFLPRDFMQTNRLFPFRLEETVVFVALPVPIEGWLKESIKTASKREVICFLATEKDVLSSLEGVYFTEEKPEKIYENRENVEVSGDIERLRDLASEAPVIRLVTNALNRALELGASDIHIEPFEQKVALRYRVDGVLREEDDVPPDMFAAVVSRIKIISGLNIAERRLPQDGRTEMRVGGREVDLRVSIIPTSHGEDVVVRILERSSVFLNLDRLGMSEEVLMAFRRLIRRPFGLILLTGPTGSGKTTTLFSALREIRSPEIKIITIEDPIEYHLEGVNQIQIKPEIGFTFASGLRSILRHDPDVILIGEIRDAETASIAIQSALTGHLVFSTLHTNDAPSAFTRLLDMGVQDYLVSSSITGVMAQRLVRKVCPSCREAYQPRKDICDVLGIDKDVVVYRAKGCRECNGTGCKGRECVAEFLEVDEHVRRAVLEHRETDYIRRIAASDGRGFKTLWSDAVDKIIAGRITMEELFREVGENPHVSDIL